MARYFDLNVTACTDLLPKRLRTHEELATIAEQSEADVIERYRFSTYQLSAVSTTRTQAELVDLPGATSVGDYVYVCLRGYTVDADDASADFRTAMRRTIAEVIRWRVAQLRANPIARYESRPDDKASITYSPDVNAPTPKSAFRWLRVYDVKPRPWSI